MLVTYPNRTYIHFFKYTYDATDQCLQCMKNVYLDSWSLTMQYIIVIVEKKKQSPATAALVKRARSVAIFSLRLRKAREAAAAKAENAPPPPKVNIIFPNFSLIISIISNL